MAVRLRPPADADAEAIAALVAARDEVDLGEVDYTVEDLRDEWAASDLERDLDTVVALDAGGETIGYAAFRGIEVLSVVHPAHENKGAGAALLAWSEQRARERGPTRVTQEIGERNAGGRALLERAGYRRVRSYSRMHRDLTAADAHAPAPGLGVSLRTLRPVADADALYEVSHSAFSRNADYQPETKRRFSEEHLQAHNLDPTLSRVAERDGRVIGFAIARRWPDETAYVDVLAVHPETAGQGLGGVLLRSVFAAAAQAGFRRAQLGVASDNPKAIGLYERAGMAERWRIDAYERELPG
jgi:mycothiol synthase